jgi:hypothetical protein
MTSIGFPSLKLPIPTIEPDQQVVLVFSGLEQYGHSYEVHIFANNTSANDKTPLDPECGYLGSFHIDGYGNMPPIAPAKRPTHHATLPMEKRHYLAAQHCATLRHWAGETISLTLVPVTDGPVRFPVREDFYVDSVTIELQSQ